MKSLVQHIDPINVSLTETFQNEQALVKSLGDALNDLDQSLLRDIRQVAEDHQTRRGSILYALEDLAASIGSFQPQQQSLQPATSPQPLAAPRPAPVAEQVDCGYQYTSPGDWRQATKNVNLQDDLEVVLNGLNGNGPRK